MNLKSVVIRAIEHINRLRHDYQVEHQADTVVPFIPVFGW